METFKYIFQHLGIGDHIMCNGLVRYFAEENDVVYLFCKTGCVDDVSYMYRDNKKIVILPVATDDDAWSTIKSNENIRENAIIVGHHGNPSKNIKELYYYLNQGKRIDRVFYEMAGISLENKTSKFFFRRDTEKENILFAALNPNNLPYIFIHDDSCRGLQLDQEKVRKDLLILRPIPGFHIFDYLKILEEAEEIHLMESSFQVMVDSQNLTKPKLFLHKYVRNHPDFMFPEISNNYEIVR